MSETDKNESQEIKGHPDEPAKSNTGCMASDTDPLTSPYAPRPESPESSEESVDSAKSEEIEDSEKPEKSEVSGSSIAVKSEKAPAEPDASAAKNSRSSKWMPLFAAMLLIIGMVGGYLLGYKNRTNGPRGKFDEVLDLIATEYVDTVNIDSLIEQSLPMILRNLDPHSAYISRAELEKANADIEGSFSGIGIRFMVIGDSIMVTELLEGGPAEKYGLAPGDRIIAVNDRDMTDGTVRDEDVPKLLKGPAGTAVKVTIYRPEEGISFERTIKRADFPLASVTSAFMINDSLGYVKVEKFARNTYQEFIQALTSLSLKGATGFVVDLRSNPGGLFDASVMMANEFLPAGRKIVETRGRTPENNSIIISDGSGVFPTAPLTVLIDENSASSSEIFAAAVQDNDRGLIIGRRSFGKGLVQKPILLNDSSEIRLTVQRYYTPSGRSIQKKYVPGLDLDYEAEILNRYTSGEVFGKEDSTLQSTEIYHTAAGREVHGGGGIMPDINVPLDTLGMSSYFRDVVDKGLIQKYAFEIADLNRSEFSRCHNVEQLMAKLPSNSTLVRSFAQYASRNGVPSRWYYINKSSLRIVNTLKAWIAEYILGPSAFYQVISKEDPTMLRAVELSRRGVTPMTLQKKSETKNRKK